MRNVFCQSLVAAADRPEFVFLTGDLGYNALEPLQHALGARFINAGVAEQNMVSVSAGLARAGFRPWVYSIAPFLYARPFEQIRNDVCLRHLPVVLVGNGGGYGYGVQGPTHHALEDYGTLLCLPGMRAFIPAVDGDVSAMAARLFTVDHPAYLRLGLSEQSADDPWPEYAPWRKLLDGDGPTMVAVGPLAGGLLAALRSLEAHRRPTLWVLCELPVAELPDPFLQDLGRSRHLFVVEEHCSQGGAARMLSHRLLGTPHAPRKFTARSAEGYHSGLFGSQKFHRRECGLDAADIVRQLGDGLP